MTVTVSRDWTRRFGQRSASGASAPPVKAKYGNKKVKGFDAGGAIVTFDSKREAKRWGELVALQRAGKISGLQRQVPFRFEFDGCLLTYKSNRKVRYICDFAYVTDGGSMVYEDAKGHSTPDYKIKWALMKWVNGIEIQEV